MNRYEYDEQRLIDEVIYLHSLWHQGPPNSLSNTSLRNPTFLTHKKNRRKRKRKKNKKTAMAATVSHPESDSGHPWPCPAPTQAPAHEGWPETRPVYPPATAEDIETHSALKIQLRACGVFRDVFFKSDEDDEDDEDEEEDYWVSVGEKKFGFFLRIFSEDGELRRYYEANREGGEYCCFVCGGLGKGKRFKSCMGLAQHSRAMSRAERNRSHWAFGQVVCRVMGWDFDRLPSIVLKGEPLGRSLDNAGSESRGESVGGDVRENVVAAKNNGGESEKLDESVGGVIRDFDNLQTDGGKCSKEDKHENPSEDGHEHENKDDNEGVSEVSTVLKTGGLGRPSAKLDDPQASNQSLVSNSGWARKEAVEKSTSAVLEWPSVTPASVVSLLSADEEAKIAADQLQYKAVRACQVLFSTNSGLDGDEFDSEDDEEKEGSADIESEDEDTDASKDSKVFNFFSTLFTERVELREFYINNHGSGDFSCLVCGGIGKKVWKRFSGCVALVQHSTAISRTKKRLAHRAYGKVICQVLGWDTSRFPSIAWRAESPAQVHTLESCNSQVEPDENPDSHRDDIDSRKSDSLNGEGLHPSE